MNEFDNQQVTDYNGSSVCWINSPNQDMDVFVATNDMVSITGVFYVQDGDIARRCIPVEIGASALSKIPCDDNLIMGVNRSMHCCFYISAVDGTYVHPAADTTAWVSAVFPYHVTTCKSHVAVRGANGVTTAHGTKSIRHMPDFYSSVALVDLSAWKFGRDGWIGLVGTQVVVDHVKYRISLDSVQLAVLPYCPRQLVAHVMDAELWIIAVTPSSSIVRIHVPTWPAHRPLRATPISIAPRSQYNGVYYMTIDASAGHLWVAGGDYVMALSLHQLISQQIIQPWFVWPLPSLDSLESFKSFESTESTESTELTESTRSKPYVCNMVAVGKYHIAIPVYGGAVFLICKPKT